MCDADVKQELEHRCSGGRHKAIADRVQDGLARPVWPRLCAPDVQDQMDGGFK